MIRLDKYLADMGVGTRSEVKNIIKKGRIYVNGVLTKDPNLKITPEDEVLLDHNKVGYQELEYVMLNKPKGLISATEDTKRATVMDCLKQKAEHYRIKDMAPVGRLDQDTTGLLLITNDGELTHALLSPKKHVEKEYFVVARDVITEAMVQQFETGLEIPESEKDHDAFMSMPAVWKQVDAHSGYLTIHEGKYHQIKRMFLAVSNEVVELKRVRMGRLMLDEALALGEARRLTKEEIQYLYEDTGKRD